MELKEFKIQIGTLRERMLQQARTLTGDADDAEDVVQDVLLKLWNRRQELDQCRHIEAFVSTAVRNACIDFQRTKHTSSNVLPEPSCFVNENDPHHELEVKNEMELVHRIICSLPPLQQTILRMKDIEGYETEEIAQITGCSSEAIRSNLSRARKRLRDIYLKIMQERRTTI